MRSISKWLICIFAAISPGFPQSLPLTISTTSLPNATLQSPYSFGLIAENALGSKTWTLESGTLPKGLTLDRDGTISGTPTESGIFNIDVKVEDAQKRADRASYTLQVKPPIVITTPGLNTPQDANGSLLATVGTRLTFLLTASGGTPFQGSYIWQLASGSQLPSWLKFDPPPDILSGIPPDVGTFSFSIVASDFAQSVPATKVLTIVVKPAISITSDLQSRPGVVGAAYSIQLASTGGNCAPSCTWTLETAPGTLPPGLSLSTAGVLGGTPQVAGTFTFGVRVADSVKASAAKSLTLVVGPSNSPGALLSSAALDFTAQAGGDAPAPQNVALISQGQPLQFTILKDGGAAGIVAPAWLIAGPSKGTTPARIRVSVDQSGLAAGKYTARVQINTTDGRQNFVTVTLTVAAGVQKLDVSPSYLRFAGSPAATATFEQNLVVRNIGGGGALTFQASALQASWLSVLPASGQAAPNAPALLRVVVNTQNRPKGATRGLIRVTSGAETVDIPVTLLVRDDGPVIGLSQDGVRFDVRETNGNSSTRNVNVLNLGTGAVNWTAEIVDGAQWLSIGAATGSATPGNPSRLSLSATPGSLKAGSYYGLVRITAPGSLNGPKYLVTVLNVGDAATAALPDPSPSGLFFVAKTGIALDPTVFQTVRVFTSSSTAAPFQVSANTSDGADWLSATPDSATTSTSAAAQVAVRVAPRSLLPGVYYGDVTFAFSSTQIRTVNVTLVVQPATASFTAKTLSAVIGCTPAKLALTQTGLTNSFATPAGWPTPLIAQLADDCGNPVLNGQLVATFSNGDPPLTMRLTDPATGLYSATWSPGSVTGSMTVTARAFAPNLTSTTADISGSVTVNKVPVLFPNRVVNNLNGVNGDPLAPGIVAQVYGSSLSTSTGEPGVLPLAKTFNGTRVLAGAFDAPLYYLSDGQLNVQLPTELSADREYSIVVAANGAYTLPDSIFLAPATPGVVAFSDKRLVAQHPDYSLITPESPARPGEAITIYLVGMGATNPTVASAAQSPGAEPLARVIVPPTVTIGGKDASISYAGLTPLAVGLYQINLTIPTGATGDLPVVITQNGVEANATVLVVR